MKSSNSGGCPDPDWDLTPPPAADCVGSGGGRATGLQRGGVGGGCGREGLDCLASLYSGSGSSPDLPEALQLCPEPTPTETGKNSSEGEAGRGGREEGSGEREARARALGVYVSMCTVEIF